MARQEPEAPTHTTSTAAPECSAFQREAKERLQKAEEFQERADGWMKEVTAQVARLATGSEKDEKRREALEKRLADIEERIRSLLTLTEMISLDKNPFASSPDETASPAPGQASAEPAAPVAAAIEPQNDAPDDIAHHETTGPSGPAQPDPFQVPAENGAGVAPAPATEQGPQNGVEVIPVGPRPKHEQPTQAENLDQPQQPEPLDQPQKTEPLDQHQQPEPDQSPQAPPAAGNENPRAYHPNDAVREPQPPASPPQPASTQSASPQDPVTQRLFVIAWADLLAPAVRSIDLDSFTDFYVESGWVDAESVRLVKPLARSMAPRDPSANVELRSLHEQTVRLIAECQRAVEDDEPSGLDLPDLNAT